MVRRSSRIRDILSTQDHSGGPASQNEWETLRLLICDSSDEGTEAIGRLPNLNIIDCCATIDGLDRFGDRLIIDN
jgi:hypothetical protein